MKRLLLCLCLISTFAAVALKPAAARDWNISVNSKGDMRSCSDIDIYSRGGQIARAEEQLTAPGGASPLRLKAGSRGGIVVYGADRNDYGIQVCKAAGGGDQSSADSLLRQISVQLQGNEVVSQGPEDEDWMVYLIVQAPRHGSVDAEAVNGPLSFHDFEGKAKVHVKNGPLSFRNCSGEINAEVQNGPVSVKGSGGDLHLRAQNGPLSVDLAGNSWTGGGLDASTVNGPLSLRLPENFQSGVRVEMSGHSPLRCRAKGCEQANKNWDEDQKSIEFNGPNVLVKMSTVNGPVSIDNRTSEY